MRGEGGEGPFRQDSRLPLLRAGDGQGFERGSQHPRRGREIGRGPPEYRPVEEGASTPLGQARPMNQEALPV